MEPLKPRDKVTQHMTRDGLTLDNQTTGESVNVSSREAEQEYTAQPEGAAEKILERADARPPQGKESGQGRRENRGAGHRPRFPVAVYRRGTGLPGAGPVYQKGRKTGG